MAAYGCEDVALPLFALDRVIRTRQGLPNRRRSMPFEAITRTVQPDSATGNAHLQSPTAALQDRAAIGADPVWKVEQWKVAATALAVKVLIFIFAAESYLILGNEPIHGFKGWLAILYRWDTVHYLDIAEHGYGGPSRDLLAFFPAYPFAVRFFSTFIPDYLASGLVVSGMASIVGAVLLYRLAQLDFSSGIARRAAWFLLIFPTSYFLHFAYAESLFLALVLGSILGARTGRWADCGITGALAGFTRINGLVLIPVLAYEAVQQYYKSKRLEWPFLAVLGPGLGFAGYLLVNLRTTGDPLAFMAVQREHWYKHLAAPWTGLRDTFKSITSRTAMDSQMIGTQELLFVGLGLVCTIYCWIKLRRAYAIWMTGNLLLFTCTSFIYSVPRYTLTMFPVYMIFALLGRNKIWNAIVTLWSLLFLSLFTGLFVRGQWAF